MKKILLIEDDPMIGKIIELKLQGETKAKGIDAQIFRVRNGQEGLELIRKENPDMIVTDLMMPVKSGFEMLAELKGDAPERGTHIIVLSNLSNSADIERATNLGVREYFVKSNTSINKVVEYIIGQL